MQKLLRAICILSDKAVFVEKIVISVFAALITLLILLNVVTRAADASLFWVDELAIYSMIWMVLIGASIMVREKNGVACILLINALQVKAKARFLFVVDGCIFVFAVILSVLTWQWYDLPSLIAVGFDLERFTGNTFNFIYDEPTTTIGIKKYLVWLVMPIISLSLCLHSTANLIENFQAAESKP